MTNRRDFLKVCTVPPLLTAIPRLATAKAEGRTSNRHQDDQATGSRRRVLGVSRLGFQSHGAWTELRLKKGIHLNRLCK